MSLHTWKITQEDTLSDLLKIQTKADNAVRVYLAYMRLALATQVAIEINNDKNLPHDTPIEGGELIERIATVAEIPEELAFSDYIRFALESEELKLIGTKPLSSTEEMSVKVSKRVMEEMTYETSI